MLLLVDLEALCKYLIDLFIQIYAVVKVKLGSTFFILVYSEWPNICAGTAFVVWWEDAYLQDYHEGMTSLLHCKVALY